MKTIAAILLLPLLVMYAAVAFTLWEPNPANWHPLGRMTLVGLWAALSGPLLGYYSENKA